MANINDFVMGFIFVLVGVILLGVVADEITGITQSNSVVNETITVTNQSLTNLANSQLDSFTSLVNATNSSDIFVLNTDYTVDLNGGSVTSLNPTGSVFATYNYREVGNSASRTLINLIIIFFALAVLGAGIGFGVKGLRDAGVI